MEHAKKLWALALAHKKISIALWIMGIISALIFVIK